MGAVPVSAGQVVRCELESGQTWFYCRVDEVQQDGDLLCTIVDAQSWPHLMLGGFVPGRQYALHPDQVLSIVR